MAVDARPGAALNVVWFGPAADVAFPGCSVETVIDADAVAARAATSRVDAVIVAASLDEAAALTRLPTWTVLLRDTPLLLVVPSIDAAAAHALIVAGVQDVLTSDEASAGNVEHRLRFAVARKALEREARKTWSTDLETGLPNRAQLLEHLSQLLALRARQPAPMALLVVRVVGVDATEQEFGASAVQVIRRKVAVRLRAAVRASDVVASLGGDTFALLLAKLESPADAQRVVIKLARALREPFSVFGVGVGVGAHVGSAIYPNDGKEPEPLLRHASGAAIAAQRRNGRAAAND